MDVSPWAHAIDVFADLDAVRAQEKAHAEKCAATESRRLLPYICKEFHLKIDEDGADDASQFAALRRALRRLGRDREPAHAAALESETSLRHALVAWLRARGLGADAAVRASLAPGEASWDEALAALAKPDAAGDHRTLLAAAGLFEVRIIVLSTAASRPLAYEATRETDRDEIVLGYFGGYLALADAPPAAPDRALDIYARFADDKRSYALLEDGGARPPGALLLDRVALTPADERHCSGACVPDFYVTTETARRSTGAAGPDMGTYVGRIEDRVPDVQYLTTPAACYKYGCYTLPAKPDGELLPLDAAST